jgi:hypothetical protein
MKTFVKNGGEKKTQRGKKLLTLVFL